MTRNSVENRQFYPPQPHLTPSLGATPFEFCDETDMAKTTMLELSVGEEIMTLALFVLIQYRRVTDGRTDTFSSQIPALRIASHG